MKRLLLVFFLCSSPWMQEAEEFSHGDGYSIGWTDSSIDISLNGSNVPDEIVGKLVRRFKNTDSISVHFSDTYCGISDREFIWLSGISGIFQITDDLWSGEQANVSEEGFKSLKRLKSLKILEFRTSSVRGISCLADLPYLSKISLVNSQLKRISDMREIEKLTQLKHLDIRNMNVDDRIIGSLQMMTWLKSLDISNTEISDAGAAYLRARLSSTNISQETETGKNKVSRKIKRGLEREKVPGAKNKTE